MFLGRYVVILRIYLRERGGGRNQIAMVTG